MPRYKITIEYDGSGLAGWQRQPDVPSVQQHIEEAIEKFCGQAVRLHTAGRTDAGVHALAQVGHFDMEKDFPPEKVTAAVNFFLKEQNISILKSELVSEEFHARFSATKRHYIYRIINRHAPLAVERNRAWQVPVPLDIKKMRKAAKHLIGKHDFSSFRDAQCQAKTPIRTMDEIRIEQYDELIEIHVSAQSFLHHMVRNITGTLKMVGQGKWEPDYIKEIIEAKDRQRAGPTAAAQGLFLVQVDYPE